MKNPLIESLHSSTARIALALVIGTSLSGCIFEEEPEPVQTTQIAPEPSGPVGPKIFYNSDEQTFLSDFKADLEDLRLADPAKARNVMMGIAQINAFKGVSVNDFDYSSGVIEVKPFEGVDVGSENFLRIFHQKVQDRFENGVTFDSIIKLGAGHSRNAVLAHESAIQRSVSLVDDKIEEINKRQARISATMGQIGVVLPQVSTLDGNIFLNMSVINSSDVPVKGMDLEVTTVNLDLEELPDKIELRFNRPILPGERRVVKNEVVGKYTFKEDVQEIPVVATVVSVITGKGARITGKEYAPARELLEGMKRTYREASRTVSSRIQQAEAAFRQSIE